MLAVTFDIYLNMHIVDGMYGAVPLSPWFSDDEFIKLAEVSKVFSKLCSTVLHFYRAKCSVARYCHDKLSVFLSVRPSVTLVDCDHMRGNSSKIISRMISLGT